MEKLDINDEESLQEIGTMLNLLTSHGNEVNIHGTQVDQSVLQLCQYEAQPQRQTQLQRKTSKQSQPSTTDQNSRPMLF